MNWLFLAVAVVLGYHAVDGFCKGFIRKAVSAVSLILTLVLVTYINPYITTFIQNYTPIHENLQEKCSELFAGNEYNEDLKTDQVLIIENMELPENLKTLLIENNNTEVYELLNVSGFHDYVGAYLANMIINAMSYLIAFLVVFTLLRVVLMALDVVTMLPLFRLPTRLCRSPKRASSRRMNSSMASTPSTTTTGCGVSTSTRTTPVVFAPSGV